MSFVNRLRGGNIAPLPQSPLLVLSHPGVDPRVLNMLAWGRDDLHVILNQEDFLFEMADATRAMGESGPLAGFRENGQQTGADHPWFGAEQTLPDTMTTALARGVQLHLGIGGAEHPKRMMLVSQRIFWGTPDCTSLIEFVLNWDNNARFLMVNAPRADAEVLLADRMFWHLEAAENAIAAMGAVFAELDATYAERALIWEAPSVAPDALPRDVALFLA